MAHIETHKNGSSICLHEKTLDELKAAIVEARKGAKENGGMEVKTVVASSDSPLEVDIWIDTEEIGSDELKKHSYKFSGSITSS